MIADALPPPVTWSPLGTFTRGATSSVTGARPAAVRLAAQQ